MKITITITKWPVTVEIVNDDLQGDVYENLEKIIDIMESREEFLFATYFEEGEEDDNYSSEEEYIDEDEGIREEDLEKQDREENH
ncbi:MAG: hypothetical protein ACTSP4_12070 [Candidatus Hodarchaeales archaeon]